MGIGLDTGSRAENLIVIGGGPAGYTAAIYAARANLAPLVLEGYGAGGQLMLTGEVENFPGFAHGVDGPQLVESMRDQAERFGARIEPLEVVKVDLEVRPFVVWTDEGRHLAHSLVIATGASARWLGIEGEERLRGFGVSSCATCDGAFFRDQDVVVVGGGDSALEEALYLARIASQVTIVHRRDRFRGSRIMVDRVLPNPRITVRWNSVVTSVVGDDRVEAVRIRDTESDEIDEIPSAALFVAIGHDPSTSLFADSLARDGDGYLITDGTRTSRPGVFAAGDVQDRVYRQAITAAASGAMAAIDAERWLESQTARFHPDVRSAVLASPAGCDQ